MVSLPPVTLPAAWAAQPHCQACELALTRAAVIPPGGPPGANLVLVSDIPEPADLRTGQLFSGTGGRRLAKLLATQGIDLAHCGRVSCCACPSQEHRRPQVPEVRACAYWLEKALQDYFAPTVIVTVGRIATEYFYGGARFQPLIAAANAHQHRLPDGARDGVRVVPMPALGSIRQRAPDGQSWHAVAERQVALIAGYLPPPRSVVGLPA